MIIIEKPELETTADAVVLSSKFRIEDEQKVLWHKFPSEYKEWLVSERVDAFLVGLLFLALKSGNDIELKDPISARLFYTVNHYLIPALCLANPGFKRIKIIAKELDSSDLNVEKVAATGLSCGVDSFATYYDHINETGPNKIKYFTFFNVGSHGDHGGENARKIFRKRLDATQKFASEVGKKVIPVDSNISEVLQMDFLETNTLRNVSCALTLQKLFKNYYVASKNRFDFFKLNSVDNQDYDALILNFLSTESTEFYSSAVQLNRVERTAFISRFPDTYHHLDVCTNQNHKLYTINCSTCDKCMRTAFTLDLLHKLDLYKNVFSIKSYHKEKKKYIGKIIATKGENQFSKEIYNFMKSSNQFSNLDHIHFFKYKWRILKQHLKKLISRK